MRLSLHRATELQLRPQEFSPSLPDSYNFQPGWTSNLNNLPLPNITAAGDFFVQYVSASRYALLLRCSALSHRGWHHDYSGEPMTIRVCAVHVKALFLSGFVSASF